MAQAVDVDAFQNVLGIDAIYFTLLAEDLLKTFDGKEMTVLRKRETADGVLYVFDLQIMDYGDLKVHFAELQDNDCDFSCDEIVFIHKKLKNVIIMQDEFSDWVASQEGRRVLQQSTIDK